MGSLTYLMLMISAKRAKTRFPFPLCDCHGITWEILDYHRGVAHHSSLLRCVALSLSKQLPTFQRIVVLSSSGSSSPDDIKDCNAFETSGIIHPTTKHNIPEDLGGH